MKGYDLPSHILRRKRDGVLLFRKRYGGRIVEIRLETQFPAGQQVPFALYQERERLLSEPMPVAGGKDINAVLRHYHAHDDYTRLKPRTKADYDKITDYLAGKLGHLQPRNIQQHHVIAWRDQWAKDTSPHKANYRTRVLSIILEHARAMGLLTNKELNPAKGVKAIKYEKLERLPWPQDMIDAFRAKATGQALFAFELALGTGQRIGDVLKMQWGDLQDGGIVVKQNKTGKPLWLPLTTHLRAALDATAPRSVFMLTNQTATGPWSYRGASKAIRDVRVAIGAQAHDIHSLRYTAAVELVLAGADDDVVAAITGQSKQMVIHYTKSARQKVHALRAKDLR